MWVLVCFSHAKRRRDGRIPDAMAQPTLLPDPTYLHLQLLDASDRAITAVVTTTSEEAECPLCHHRWARIHSRSVRLVADWPWAGWAVQLELHVRRFFCPNQQCVRQIFTERLPEVVARLGPTNHAFDRSLHAHRVCSRRGSRQAPGGWNGGRDQS